MCILNISMTLYLRVFQGTNLFFKTQCDIIVLNAGKITLKTSTGNNIHSHMFSSLHHGLAQVGSFEEAQEGIKHVVKTNCHMLVVLQLAL